MCIHPGRLARRATRRAYVLYVPHTFDPTRLRWRRTVPAAPTMTTWGGASLGAVSPSYENAAQQWREGERRAAALDPGQRAAVDRVTDHLVASLRRRLGGRFSVSELVELYDQGTGWCLDEAFKVAPAAPWAWDPRVTADAAFARYVREAQDFAGGRRLDPDA